MTKMWFLSLFLMSCASAPFYSQQLDQREVDTLSYQEAIKKMEKSLMELKEENQKLKAKLAEKEIEISDLKTKVNQTFRMPTGIEIQTALKNAKFYKGKIDGIIGEETKEAIRNFQKANNLTTDGVVGSKTWEKLKQYLIIE